MTTNIRKPEILAPCGSYEILKAAIHAGADACYVGGDKFGARAYAQNLDHASLLDAIEFAHLHNCKLYLTVNTLLKDNEIAQLDDYIGDYYAHGLDAVIVQDIGVFHYIKTHYPGLNIHCSTQMNITSWHGAQLMKQNGATRVVVAREMPLDEIAYVKAKVDIEVEAFVHGAMCYSYSGQCLLSSLAGGRSGNRGRCAQPCRKKYDGAYLLSMKDMCSLVNIPKLVDAGIDSFKIEGRMKNEYYVASAVDAYNTLVNDYLAGCFRHDKAEEYKFKLASIYNRGGFSDGYFFMHNGSEMISKDRPNNQGVCVGRLTDVNKGTVKIKLTRELFKQDVLEIKLSDDSSMDLTSGISGMPGMTVSLNAPKTRLIKVGQDVYRTRCNHLIDEITNNIIGRKKQTVLSGRFCGIVGQAACFTVSCCLFDQAYEGTAYGDLVEASLNKKADMELIKNKLSQLGNTDYVLTELDICVDENAFIPLSVLKHLKREAIRNLEANVKRAFGRTDCLVVNEDTELTARKSGNADIEIVANRDTDIVNNMTDCADFYNIRVYTEHEKQLQIVLNYDFVTGIILDAALFSTLSDACMEAINATEKELYILLPDIIKNNFDLKKYLPNKHINGIYIRNIDGLSCVCDLDEHILHDIHIICASSLYAYNQNAVSALEGICPSMTYELPVELNLKELALLREQTPNVPYEMLLYGHTRVMLTAQCIGRTKGTCSGNHEIYKIKDDLGNVFYSVSHCEECYSRLYNKSAFCMLDKDVADIAKQLKASCARIDFTIETTETVKQVLDVIYHRLILGDKTFALDFDTTTGHLFRGVE
ncbi:MAG: U32 family peptidase [Clostridium sp.]|nr:U32 family peptidase [Clostridium sp.]MCM1458594.1 U32 family peptidase [Bacteroides sp.]